MDPRHPEQAVSRIRELMKQYDRIEKDMNSCTVANKLGQLEREGGLVVQEICLVAPRMHEAMMQTSRQRRHDISRGLVEKPVENIYEEVRAYSATAEIVVHDPQPEEYIKMPKKKTTKKVDIPEPDVNEIAVAPVEAAAMVEDLELVSTEVKDSDDKISFEVKQTYKPKKKTTKKKAE